VFSERIIHLLIQRGINSMIRFAKSLLCMAAIAGAIMFGRASPAYADIDIQLTIADNSGDSITGTYDFTTSKLLSSTGTGSYSGFFAATTVNGQEVLALVGGAVGGYNVTVSAAVTNASGTPTLAFVNSTNNTISGTGTGLTITSSADGFTTPSSPPAPALLLSTSSSATTNSGNTVTSVTYAGYAGTTLSGSELTSASASYSTPGGAGSGSGPNIYSVFSNGGPYSRTDVLSIGAGNAQFGSLSGQVDVTPLPEPASMMTALAAMPFLAMGAWLRRRKQVAIA
jgi:hypothetical protein